MFVLKVIVKGLLKWDLEKKSFVVEGEVYLPVLDNNYLHPLLRKEDELFFGWNLKDRWGEFDESLKMRKERIPKIYGVTREEAEQKFQKYVLEQVEKLKRVLKLNKESLAQAKIIEYEFNLE